MVRPRVRDLFEAYYPAYGGEEAAFREHLDAAITGSIIVLDAGCGSGALHQHDLHGSGRFVVGVDVDEAVARNTRVTCAVRATLDALPLRSESVDVVLSHYVLEHLANPRQVFGEVARVLRPGGRFVFLTPNAFHYVTLISRLTPTWLHRFVKSGHGLTADDVFPTYYRANTRRTIERLASDAGLQVASVDLVESSPNYLEFSRVLYRAGVAYQRIVSRFASLAPFRVNIVATLAKSAGPLPLRDSSG